MTHVSECSFCGRERSMLDEPDNRIKIFIVGKPRKDGYMPAICEECVLIVWDVIVERNLLGPEYKNVVAAYKILQLSVERKAVEADIVSLGAELENIDRDLTELQQK